MVTSPYDFHKIKITNHVENAISKYTKDKSRDPIEGWISGNDAQTATAQLGEASKYNSEWITEASRNWGRFTRSVYVGSNFNPGAGQFVGLKISWGSTDAGFSPWGNSISHPVATLKPMNEQSNDNVLAQSNLFFAKSSGHWRWIANPVIETGHVTANNMWVKNVDMANGKSVTNVDTVAIMIANGTKTFAFAGTFYVHASSGQAPNNWTQGLIAIPAKG